MRRFSPRFFIKLVLLGLPVALILLLTVSAYWLLHTASGAAWLWSQAEDVAAGSVRSSNVEGDLASGFVIRGLEYRSGGVDFSVARAEIQATPGMRPLSIQVQGFSLDDVEVVLPPSGAVADGEDVQMDIHSVLTMLKLPVPLEVHAAVVTNIRLRQGEEPPRKLLDSLRFQAALDERLIVEQLQLSASGIELGLNGFLVSEPPFELVSSVQGRFRMTGGTDTADLILPFSLEVSGDLDNVHINHAILTGPGTDLHVTIEANIDTESNSLNAQLDWTGFRWPLTAATPAFLSPSGSMSVAGNFDQWTSTGQLDVQTGDYPQGSFKIQGGGSRTSARISMLEGQVLGGSVSGELGANWEDGLAWDTAVRARGIDPEPLLPDWPGYLDGQLEMRADSRSETIQVELASLHGRIRGIPVKASGGFDIAGDDVTFSHLDIRTDEAILVLDGNWAEPSGIGMTFNGYLPGLLLAGASGQVEAQARYSSHGGAALELSLEARELAWNGYSARDLSLQVSHAGRQHSVSLDLAMPDFTLSTEMTVAPDNEDEPFASTWRGTVETLEAGLNQQYTFSLSEPAGVEWSGDSALLGPVCLHEADGAKLCVTGDYQATGDWSLLADNIFVPVDYLRNMLELDIRFEQSLEGRLEWHQPQNQAETGSGQFRITAGQILDLLDNDVLLETREGRFAFTLADGNLESGVLDLEFPGLGMVDIDFEVMDLIGAGPRKLQGRVVTELGDVGQLGQLFLPGADRINGVFQSNVQLGGTLKDPVFDGGFKLSHGFFQYNPLGLKLEDVEFEGRVEARDMGSFKGQFRAGQGIGSLDGRFHFEDFENLQMDLAFSGDRLLLVNTNALKIHTETDLKLGLSPQRVEIDGFVRIPSARLTPASLLLETVNDSEDLVIETAGPLSGADTDEAPSADRYYGQLEVAFGDDVLIEVPGAKTNISGNVLFNWSGDPVPLAQGSYVLKGEVDIYGPVLQINKGHISFPDVPADNPLLNIRAEREIFGNTQIRSAGVQVIGTLKRPLLEAYTVPVTNEDRAWSLLVTGTDFDQGQGVGGFDVGTYIAPKLYVSYGISLFEDENVISARYDLKKGFGIKVTSGQRETGLDVSYTIDK